MSFEANNFEEEKNLFNDLRLVMDHLYHINCAQYNKICELNTAIEERDANISQLKEELQTVNINYEQEKGNNADKLQQQADSFNAELAKKDDLVKQSLAAFEIAKDRYDTLNQRLKAKENQLSEDEAKLAKDKEIFNEEKKKNENLKKNYDSLQAKYDSLNEIATSNSTDNRKLKNENVELNKKLEDADAKIRELSEEIDRLKANAGGQNANAEEQPGKPVTPEITTGANNSASDYVDDFD